MMARGVTTPDTREAPGSQLQWSPRDTWILLGLQNQLCPAWLDRYFLKVSPGSRLQVSWSNPSPFSILHRVCLCAALTMMSQRFHTAILPTLRGGGTICSRKWNRGTYLLPKACQVRWSQDVPCCRNTAPYSHLDRDYIHSRAPFTHALLAWSSTLITFL